MSRSSLRGRTAVSPKIVRMLRMPMPRTSRKSRSTAGQRPSIVSGEMRNSSTMSSAMRPLPREMSSSASSLLPIADAPVISTPISSTSRNTPCSVVDSREHARQVEAEDVDDVRRRLRRREQRDVVLVALSSRCCGTSSPLATTIATSSVVNSRSIERLELVLRQAAQVRELPRRPGSGCGTDG